MSKVAAPRMGKVSAESFLTQRDVHPFRAIPIPARNVRRRLFASANLHLLQSAMRPIHIHKYVNKWTSVKKKFEAVFCELFIRLTRLSDSRTNKQGRAMSLQECVVHRGVLDQLECQAVGDRRGLISV